MATQTRPSQDFYYLEIAHSVSRRSTCLNKHWGAVIVKNGEIISTGYNGSPRGTKNCNEIGTCYRITNKIPRGTRYEACRSIHGEANAIISAARRDMIGGTMYIYGFDVVNDEIVKNPDSCMMCKRMIINAGITEVIFADPDGMMVQDNPGGKYGIRIVKVEDWAHDEGKYFGSDGY